MEDFEIDDELWKSHDRTIYKVHMKRVPETFYCIKISQIPPTEEEKKLNELSVQQIMKLTHPNLVKCYGYFYDEENFMTIHELADAGNLRQKMIHPLPEINISLILKQVLDGLQHLHESQFFHLNLKPENILFFDSVIKLDVVGLNQREVENYISPEKLLYAEAKYASDIWGIGVITYEMAAGKLPFQGKDFIEFRKNVLLSRFEELESSFSPEFKSILDGMLIKDPDQRINLSDLLEFFR